MLLKEAIQAQRLRVPMRKGDLESRFEFEWTRAKILYAILKGKLNFTGKRVLDIGCGCGGMTTFFEQTRADIVGFDYDKKEIDFGKRKKSFPKLFVGNCKALACQSNKFDILICSSVIDHIPREDHEAFIEDCLRVLNEDGYLVLSFNSSKSILAKLMKIDKNSDTKIDFRYFHSLINSKFEVTDIVPFWLRPRQISKLHFINEFLIINAIFILKSKKNKNKD